MSDTDAPGKKMHAYLQAIVDIGKKHGFCLSHQDGYCDFKVVPRNVKQRTVIDLDEWLLAASLDEEQE